MHPTDAYLLLDVGGGARLERFGERIVDRPHSGALGSRGDPGAWRQADLRFDRDRGWTGEPSAMGPWPIRVGDVTLELRPTEAGQLGVFPEHLAMLQWLTEQVRARIVADDLDDPGRQPPSVLHAFAYTGLATLAIASAGAAVTHVDSSRPTVAWARANAERSRLADRPIRWIVDDALAFIHRELRRNRRYDGLILDPPSYGHGPRGQDWRLERDVPTLLAGSARLLAPNGFVLLTAHSPGFDGDRLAIELASAVRTTATPIERGELAVATDDGRRLELGAFARWPGGA
jgi:23S rRNA (cytosine1962-C5)-methyltransferase